LAGGWDAITEEVFKPTYYKPPMEEAGVESKKQKAVYGNRRFWNVLLLCSGHSTLLPNASIPPRGRKEGATN